MFAIFTQYSIAQQSEKKIGRNKIIEDMEYLNNSLNDAHCNLYAYTSDEPFKWNSEFTLKTSKFLKEHSRKHNDTTSTYFQKILAHKNGEIYNYEFDDYQPQPKQKRFNGEVYVLVNRQSHSQSAVTASQIQDYKFGTIVGEETGDFPTLYASQFQYTLPNTGIVVKVSKGQIVRVNGSKKPEGVIPDMMIRDHLLDDVTDISGGTGSNFLFDWKIPKIVRSHFLKV